MVISRQLSNGYNRRKEGQWGVVLLYSETRGLAVITLYRFARETGAAEELGEGLEEER